MPGRRRLLVVCLLAMVVGIGGCSLSGSGGGSATAGSPPARLVKWPAPSDPLDRAVAAGLVPETVEHLVFHVHAHLDVFINGVPVVVPAGLGINIQDPGVMHGPGPNGDTAYGGITGCGQPCISPLHTHDTTGIIHTESLTPTPNTLGQLFVEWGVTLSRTCVGEYCAPQTAIVSYTNGAVFGGDPTSIQLTDHLEIAIVIGMPPATIPSSADFSQI